ncbi:MAG: (deoxy)nucleoside triphosphate pyrophosphohydrolase [Chitinispirillaceae bacterium]|nr:(deoxy)nucleoside triphosphate pyrophosphohydrolase [Chitinispirillaceae bacterium]
MNSITVAAAVIIENGHVLIARRSEGELAGLWEFPGGKIESGETVQQGLVREIAEELCLGIDVGEFLTTTRFRKNDSIIDLYAYLCVRKDRKDQVLKVHSETAWVNKMTIQQYRFIPADMVFVEKLLSCAFL